MIRTLLSVLGILTVLLLSSACAVQVSGAMEPGLDAGRLRSFYVVTVKQGAVPQAIKEELTSRGYQVSLGEEANMPANVDSKVLFNDKWMWDITVYLLEVKIDLVDPKTGAMQGSGRSYRTSLARKSTEFMVKEGFA